MHGPDSDAICNSGDAARASIRGVHAEHMAARHAETLAVLDQVHTHYGYAIEQFGTPDQEAVDKLPQASTA